MNRLGQEIWVAASPDTAHPLTATGWALPPGHSVTITVPNQYNGRFWGRTGCVFHGSTGHCQTGDCGGRFQCTGWGAIPATLAAPRSMCDPAKWPVDYAAIFKRAEPYAYSYVDDDATSVYTCRGTCNYDIVFGVTPRG